ncbi:D-2-hydroxyacid dehydrogenase [Acetivibrio cellulolyticus]|uniref:D-2-hydroxyacid dehydrogenase n=1 Tax=Acetivibrio cellulolyticus TaxID=35830 RepID=UPI0002481C41|nr:D-2-hydroxyacid dehydrogenase [Acetivibrio cellulolyticus]
MLRICFLDAKTLGSDANLSGLAEFGDISIYNTTKSEDVIDRIKDQDIVITNKVVLNESNLKPALNLKLICVAATGTNNIDLGYAKSRGIAVTNVAGYSTQSVAQHTFAMLFYLLESLKYYDEYVKSMDYSKSDVFTHLEKPFTELYGKTWGIIGLGTIGGTVACIARAFGCRVVYYSTSGMNNNGEYERVELDKLMEVSDIVSIHAPLNDRTRNLIDYRCLQSMKKSAILINLGRGGIVNENDLAKALDEDLIMGAALDVLESEPIKPSNPLLALKKREKLIITPHIAWASVEARRRLINELNLNIKAFLNNEVRNRVD